MIDIGIIGLYSMVLYLISSFIKLISGNITVVLHPVTGQLIGFFLLTVPVFFYYYIFERKLNGQSPGKKWNGLRLIYYKKTPPASALKRTIIKILPWEIAHTGVHWLVFYIREGYNYTPFWVMSLLIISQLMVLINLVFLFHTKGRQTYYDKLSGTEIVEIKAMQA